MDLSAQLSDRELGLEQRLGREGAERQDHFGTDQLDLADQIR
jgi:hypothetical protein